MADRVPEGMRLVSVRAARSKEKFRLDAAPEAKRYWADIVLETTIARYRIVPDEAMSEIARSVIARPIANADTPLTLRAEVAILERGASVAAFVDLSDAEHGQGGALGRPIWEIESEWFRKGYRIVIEGGVEEAEARVAVAAELRRREQEAAERDLQDLKVAAERESRRMRAAATMVELVRDDDRLFAPETTLEFAIENAEAYGGSRQARITVIARGQGRDIVAEISFGNMERGLWIETHATRAVGNYSIYSVDLREVEILRASSAGMARAPAYFTIDRQKVRRGEVEIEVCSEIGKKSSCRTSGAYAI